MCLLGQVPVLSLWDLGVLRDIQQADNGRVTITITPTYSGCPALEAMQQDIAEHLNKAGFTEHEIKVQLTPAWTTDGLSPEGHEKLRAYGIAPPQGCAARAITPESGLKCPHCGSEHTRRISEFGSTACKALFQCADCQEPFDYFKAI